MKKVKNFRRAHFSADVIKEAATRFEERVPHELKEKPVTHNYVVQTQNDEWTHDSEEEFFADYRREIREAVYQCQFGFGKYGLQVFVYDNVALLHGTHR